MTDIRDATYGDEIAPAYDELLEIGSTDTDDAVAFFDEIAPGRRVLELGIGTGRLAIPLARRGYDVHGMDTSTSMIEVLRGKDPQGLVKARVGDMAEFRYDLEFDLILVAASTFYFVRTQERQLSCLRQVRRHLAPQGLFVIEAFIPKPSFGTEQPNVYLSRSEVSEPGMVIAAATHESLSQRLRGHKIFLGASGNEVWPYDIRYTWPSELDLMARLNGLELRDRWADFSRRPLHDRDDWHVSVYRRSTADPARPPGSVRG